MNVMINDVNLFKTLLCIILASLNGNFMDEFIFLMIHAFHFLFDWIFQMIQWEKKNVDSICNFPFFHFISITKQKFKHETPFLCFLFFSPSNSIYIKGIIMHFTKQTFTKAQAECFVICIHRPFTLSIFNLLAFSIVENENQ